MTKWREILVVTGGSTPQIVTETVYALATRPLDPIVPSKIICVITHGVSKGFGQNLEDALGRLAHSLELDANWTAQSDVWTAAENGLFVECAQYEDGMPVEDIRSEADATHFGDLVSEVVRTETSHEDSRVHLSLAGGRKIMSFHGGAAMSLFGRAQDELSHVLVHPPEYEGCQDFWFPTQTRETVHHRDGREFDASQAKVHLALVPFLRIRNHLPEDFSLRKLDYAANIVRTNAVLGRIPLFLELVTSERSVLIGDLASLTLSNTEFALYQLMAEWKLYCHKGASPTGIGRDHQGWLTAHMFEYPELYHPNPISRFISIYGDTFKSGTERSDSMPRLVIPRPLDESQREGNERNFSQWKARLFRNLQNHLQDSDLADRFGAPRLPIKVECKIEGKKSRRIVFGVKLDAREIIIRTD